MFKKGDLVWKELLFFGEVTEIDLMNVACIKNNIIYLSSLDDIDNVESGITYRQSGDEIERFFLPHSISQIHKLDGNI